jgi:uncharacterized protein YbjQ (UPF0145 family)
MKIVITDEIEGYKITYTKGVKVVTVYCESMIKVIKWLMGEFTSKVRTGIKI